MHLTDTHGLYREVAGTSAVAGGGTILLELGEGMLEVVHLLLHRRCRIRGQLPNTTVVGAGLLVEHHPPHLVLHPKLINQKKTSFRNAFQRFETVLGWVDGLQINAAKEPLPAATSLSERRTEEAGESSCHGQFDRD
jgi:hypothetical protein